MRHKRTEGYHFNIEHIAPGRFYITVTAPDGCYIYDGYLEKDGATIIDAMEEALCGSGLNKRRDG